MLQASAGNRAVTTLLEPVRPASAARPATTTLHRASAAMGEGAQPWVRPGDRGQLVTDLQNKLNTIGSGGTPLAVTGRYDAATRVAVDAFQTENGLDADGIVGPLTYEALDRKTETTAETVTAGTDVTGDADAPTQAEIDAIEAELNPTSAGPGGTAQGLGRPHGPGQEGRTRHEDHGRHAGPPGRRHAADEGHGSCEGCWPDRHDRGTGRGRPPGQEGGRCHLRQHRLGGDADAGAGARSGTVRLQVGQEPPRRERSTSSGDRTRKT